MVRIVCLKVNLSMKWHNTAYNLVVLNRYYLCGFLTETMFCLAIQNN